VADKHSKEIRRMNMSHILSKNTKPEERVRKYLFSRGLRYRKNVKTMPGCPDIVFPKYHTVVFVNGCFWHKHDCGRFVWPSTNQEYWNKKIIGNAERDRKKQMYAELEYQEIINLLAKHQGNISRVARDMGISRNTIYRKMKQYNIRFS
jgi:DNA mismatch endonuclease (patch repair protein)